jgi:hypothetical protein
MVQTDGRKKFRNRFYGMLIFPLDYSFKAICAGDEDQMSAERADYFFFFNFNFFAMTFIPSVVFYFFIL